MAQQSAYVMKSDGRELLLATLRNQWKGVTAGVLVGLTWTAGKVSVPLLVVRAT